MPLPKLTPIESSMLSGHAYDPGTRELHVQFKNGARYVYHDVPVEKYAAFTGAQSPGSFLNNRIKPVHNSRKVRE